jgi:hypothetical protein
MESRMRLLQFRLEASMDRLQEWLAGHGDWVDRYERVEVLYFPFVVFDLILRVLG